MTTTPVGNSPYGTAIPLTITLAGVGTGGMAVSSAFTPPSDAAGTYYDTADIRVNLGAATALGTTAIPYLQAGCVAELDGTNLPYIAPSNGTIVGAETTAWQNYLESGTGEYLDIPGLPLLPGPNPIAVAILNGLGITIPTGTTATLYPRMGAVG